MDERKHRWLCRETSNGYIFYGVDTRQVYRGGANIVPSTSQDIYRLRAFDSRVQLKVHFDFIYYEYNKDNSTTKPMGLT